MKLSPTPSPLTQPMLAGSGLSVTTSRRGSVVAKQLLGKPLRGDSMKADPNWGIGMAATLLNRGITLALARAWPDYEAYNWAEAAAAFPWRNFDGRPAKQTPFGYFVAFQRYSLYYEFDPLYTNAYMYAEGSDWKHLDLTLFAWRVNMLTIDPGPPELSYESADAVNCYGYYSVANTFREAGWEPVACISGTRLTQLRKPSAPTKPTHTRPPNNKPNWVATCAWWESAAPPYVIGIQWDYPNPPGVALMHGTVRIRWVNYDEGRFSDYAEIVSPLIE